MALRRSRVNLSFDIVGSENATVSGGKSPIIFLHGLTSAKETWKNIIHPIAVATGRKAYAYDARNHGDSGWSEEFHYEIMQEDLLEFIDCLHAKRVVLIGHSMGGKTAMFFATKYPERVEKLIVEDISPKPSQPHLRTQIIKYFSFLKFALEQIPSEIKDLDEAKNFVQDFLHRKEDKEQESSRPSVTDGSTLPLYQNEDGKFRWKTNLKVIEDSFLGTPNQSTLIGTYPGPTLILYGTKSPYKVSADRDFIRKAFTSSQFRAIEGATHQIHLEFEDIFVKEVTDFINDL